MQSASLQVGDTFVLNCLGEGQYGPLMKVRRALVGSSMRQAAVALCHHALSVVSALSGRTPGPGRSALFALHCYRCRLLPSLQQQGKLSALFGLSACARTLL